MQRRILGLETEYGITCRFEGKKRLNPDEIARYLFAPIVAWARSSNVFLGNGSRLYLDVGSHPEFATAETNTPAQLVQWDRAGDAIVDDLARQAEKRLQEEGIGGQVFLFKNNVDSAGNSYGSHENYLIGRGSHFNDLTGALVPFLITRQIIVGAGHIVQDRDGESRWSFSQRAEHMWDGVSSATTRSRPLINTRDEPHADSERYRRLHVIAGDSTMSETTTALRFASTALLLELLEAGVQLPRFEFDNQTKAIRAIALDPTGGLEIPLVGGGTTTAVTVQRAFHAAAADYLRNRPAPAEEEAETAIPTAEFESALDLWGRGITAVETGDLTSVHTELDWAIKRSLLERYRQRGGWDWDHPRLAQLNLAYHDIRPDRGIFPLLVAKGLAATVVTPQQVEQAVTHPPQTTRAKLRGQFVSAARAAGADYTVDWVHLKVSNGQHRTLLCKDPFQTVDARVDQLLGSLRT